MKSSTPKHSSPVSANMAQLQARAKALRLAGLLAHWDTLVCDPARLGWVTELLDWEETERDQHSLERRLRAAHIGKFKPLAILSKARSPFLSNVPTVMELNLPGLQNYEVVGWTGLVAPAATPREVVNALNAEVTRIFANAEMRELLAAQSLQSFPAHTPDVFAAYIRTELASWRAMAKAAGVEGMQ